MTAITFSDKIITIDDNCQRQNIRIKKEGMYYKPFAIC